jgi:hypothetical protein
MSSVSTRSPPPSIPNPGYDPQTDKSAATQSKTADKPLAVGLTQPPRCRVWALVWCSVFRGWPSPGDSVETLPCHTGKSDDPG